MIITFSGKPGSGKSTIARRVAAELGFYEFYAGQILRNLAKEEGMHIMEYLTYLEDHPEVEKEIDRRNVRAVNKYKDVVVQSRVATVLFPQAVHIFLDVDLEVAGKRIHKDLKNNDQRNEIQYTTEQETIAAVTKRAENEQRRYKVLYDIDLFDASLYDLVIDTTHLTPDEVFAKVMEFLEQKKR